MKKEETHAENLHKRLAIVAGQVTAISRMADAGADCEDLLIQINAAKRALHKIAQSVFEEHLKHCVREGIENGDAESTIEDFLEVIKQFNKI